MDVTNKNIEAAKEYMRISYSPKESCGANVKHLCAEQNTFIAPTTFPDAHDCLQYADEHKVVMESLPDLKITSFDVVFGTDTNVCIRYSAQGSHIGKNYSKGGYNIPASGKKARWTASMIFTFSDGKITKCIKEWDKLSMWKQLDWPIEHATDTSTLQTQS